MATTTIPLKVDQDTARAFAAASAEDRRKLQLLLSLRLRELTARPPRPLKEVMGDIGRHAEARGLTAGILESVLRDE
jgi:hypothetical protein